MHFLKHIEQYWFLTETTRSLLTNGMQEGKITEQEQQEIIAICEKNKKLLEEEERKLLTAIVEEESQLLQHTHKLERDIHRAEERFERKDDTNEMHTLETKF